MWQMNPPLRTERNTLTRPSRRSRIDVTEISWYGQAEQRIFPDVEDGRQTKCFTEAKPEKYLRNKNPP